MPDLPADGSAWSPQREGAEMRLAILGATGRIGSHLLNWAVDAGHRVHVLARDAAAVPVRPGITVTEGSALDPVTVANVVGGADAVLSALGPRGAKAPALLATAGFNVVSAMAKTGVRRLISVSAAGAFVADDPDARFLIKLILPRVLAKPFADVRAMEQVVQASDLDWTLVRATRLVDTPVTGRYQVCASYPPPGLTKISRADVAHFIIRALTDCSYLHQTPALAY